MIIELTQGKSAEISDEDAERVLQYKWYARKYTKRPGLWYAVSNIEGKKVSLHRFILNCKVGDIVDHIDGNGLNNRRENIRLVSYASNNQNSKRGSSGCSSDYKGVIWNTQRNKWQARMTVDYHLIHLGFFEEEIEAAKAYNATVLEWYGEGAWINKL